MNITKVLVVEDLEKWQASAKRNLAHHRLPEPTQAYNLEEALEAYQREMPQLIITDINLDPSPTDSGNRDGFEVCRQIRSLDSEVFIAVMSSCTPVDEYRQRSFEAGANVYVDKSNFVKEFDTLVDRLKIYGRDLPTSWSPHSCFEN